MMTIVKVFLFILGVLFVLGIVSVVTVALVGRKLYVSWKKPYKDALQSFDQLPIRSRSFIEAFVEHPIFGEWFKRNGRNQLDTLAVAYCASDERKRMKIMERLPKETKRRLHQHLKQMKQITQEDAMETANVFKEYMQKGLENPTKNIDMDFYTLYFHDEYAPALKIIQQNIRYVNATLRDKIEQVVSTILRSVPYYKERRMYEQTHKLETVLMKDLPGMLQILSQFSPSQRLEKESELEAYLQEFSKDLQQTEDKINADIEQQLVVKMRATTEKFRTT
jgi:hypothetical protein